MLARPHSWPPLTALRATDTLRTHLSLLFSNYDTFLLKTNNAQYQLCPSHPPLLMLLLAQVWPAWMMQGWPLQEQNMQKPSLSVREWTYTDRSSIHYSLETVRWMRVPTSVYPWHRASHFHTFVSSDTCPTLFRPLMFMHKMSQHEFYIQLRTWGPVLSEVWNKHK